MNLEAMKQKQLQHILMFSVPAIIGMLLSAVVTVTDGYFVGNYVGRDGLAAVNLGLPIVYLLIACGLMVGVGGSAIAGIMNGNGQKQESRRVFSQTMVTALVASAAISAILFILFGLISKLLGASGTVEIFFRQYYTIMIWYYPVMVVNNVFGMFMRAEGKPGVQMVITIISVMINVALDAVSVWMKSGIQGIAIASMISGIITLVLNISFFLKKAETFRFCTFSFDGRLLKDTLFNGSSEFIGEMASCVSMFCYNRMILTITGAEGVAAFTVAGYTIFVFSMIVIGFGQGMSALVSFTFGAEEFKLATAFRRKTNQIVLLAGAVFSLILVLGAKGYGALFVKDVAVQSMIVDGIRLFVVSFLLMGYNILASMYFTACGKAAPSAIISMARGLVILLICIFVLPIFFGMNGIWLSAPVTEVISAVISFGFLKKESVHSIA